jgi:hypothetical protein
MNFNRVEVDQSLDDNLMSILKEFENLKGQFVITETLNIERLIAIGKDDWDYYYITYDGKKTRWNTCVGRLIPLRGYIQDEDYENLIHSAKLNHHDQMSMFDGREIKERKKEIQDFIDYHKKYITEINLPDIYLTEICWDLN